MQSVQRKHAYAGTLVMVEDPMVAVMEQVLTDEEVAQVITVAGSRIAEIVPREFLPHPEWRVIRLLDRRISNPLTHKGALPKLLWTKGLTHLAPPTYDSIADALAAHADGSSLWFFKSVYGTGGEGMFCVAHGDLQQQVLPPDFILQAGVSDIEPDAGRKFTARIYLLIWAGQLYFYHNGFTVTHGPDYAADSTDHAVQIDHRGSEKPDSAARIALGLEKPIFSPVQAGAGAATRDCRESRWQGVQGSHSSIQRSENPGFRLDATG